jgi:hypothetical protein
MFSDVLTVDGESTSKESFPRPKTCIGLATAGFKPESVLVVVVRDQLDLRGPRSDQAHLPAEHVDELLLLIDDCPSKYSGEALSEPPRTGRVVARHIGLADSRSGSQSILLTSRT